MRKQPGDRAFPLGWEMYGDLQFDMQSFDAHLQAVCTRCLETARGAASREELLGSLQIADLYLAFGCARGCDRAWTMFARQFHDYIMRLACGATKYADDATELAGAVMVDLYLPDRGGVSRIASYDGRSTLGTWLRVLVNHRAVTEHRRNRLRPRLVESLPEQMDEFASTAFDSELRAHRYQHAIQTALDKACNELSDRDRELLLLRFGAETKLQQLATYLDVHPSNVSREIKRLCIRIRAHVIRVLGSEYRLCNVAIEECLSDIVEDPAYSVLARLESSAAHAVVSMGATLPFSAHEKPRALATLVAAQQQPAPP